MTQRTFVMAAVAAIAVSVMVFGATQPRMEGAGSDGARYLKMATDIRAGLAPSVHEPFVRRVLVPFLAARLSGATGGRVEDAFFWLNIIASVVVSLLFAWWLSTHVADPVTCLAVLIMFLVTPYGPIRFTFFYPILTDPVADLFLVSGLIGMDALRARVTVVRVVAVSVLIFLGCLCREAMFVVAVAAQLALPWRNDVPVWLARVFTLASAGAGMMVAAALVVPSPSDYSLFGDMLYFMKWKELPQMQLALAFVFGPALALLAVQWRCVWLDMVRRPDWVVFIAAFALLSWVGGSDTERILQFGLPAFLMFVALALSRVTTRSGVAVVIVTQLIAYRVGISMGGPLAASPAAAASAGVQGVLASLGAFESFFSFFLPRPWLITFLVVYMTLLIVIAATRALTSSATCINVKSIDA